MHMLGQYDPRMNNERMPSPHDRHHTPQQVDMPRQQVVPTAPHQINGKKIRTATYPNTTIFRHRSPLDVVGRNKPAL
jgi:hypothetical protein